MLDVHMHLPGRHPTKKLAESSHAKESQKGDLCLSATWRSSTQGVVKTHGFASPVFTGFAVVVCYGAILARNFTILPYLALQSTFKIAHSPIMKTCGKGEARSQASILHLISNIGDKQTLFCLPERIAPT